MPDTTTEVAREHWPATLWAMADALETYENAFDLCTAGGLESDATESVLARGVSAVMAAHSPERRAARTRGLISGVLEAVPEHAVCSGACRRVGRDEPHPWPCPAIAPLLDGLGLGVVREGGVVGRG